MLLVERRTVAAQLDRTHTRDDVQVRRRQHGDQRDVGRDARRYGTGWNRNGDDPAVGRFLTLDLSLAIDVFMVMNGGTVTMIVTNLICCGVDVKCDRLRLKDAD